jgi:manganese-dependent inorganic pyrophosphatase
MKTFVVGHKNPDTDSIVSAIVLAKIEGHEPARTGDVNKETEFVLKRFGQKEPIVVPKEAKQIILVDHNSPDEVHENIKNEEIIGIIDHHRLGGPFSESPLAVYMKPCGSTSTIVALIADDHNYSLNHEEASLLISGIISDTLNFTSPTTTDLDREVLERLNGVAGLDVNELAAEMFAAKSDISGIKTEDLIGKDYKVFDMSGKKVGIGVWETTNPQSILDRKEEIHKILKDKKKNEKLDYILFGAVDILEGATQFILDTDPEVALVADVFGAVTKEGVAYLENTVSRKKQIVPKLENFLAQ